MNHFRFVNRVRSGAHFRGSSPGRLLLAVIWIVASFLSPAAGARSAAMSQIDLAGNVTFTVQVTNTGTADPVTVTSLKDSIHGNLNGQGSCSLPRAIPEGDSYRCIFGPTITGNAGYTETDVVTASGADDDGAPVNGSAGAMVAIVAQPSTETPPPNATNAPTSTPTGTPTCNTCLRDSYESDDVRQDAKPLPMDSTSQVHTLQVRADVDWFVINNLTPGWWYNVSTSDLVGGTDTVMILYDQSNVIFKTNDDIEPVRCLTQPRSQYCASSISWKPTYSGPYYVSVRTLTYSPQAYPSCSCPGYNITGRTLREHLPIIIGQPPATPTPTPTGTEPPTLTPTPTPTSTPTPQLPGVVPGLSRPNGVAVNPRNHMVYVTARDENRLYMIDGLSLAVVNSVQVGHRPWGVSINPNTNKVYVANFASADVWVLDGTSLAVLATIHVGPEPTFVKVNESTNTAFVITYGNNGLAVINGDTDRLIGVKGVGGAGAWGLAINPNLNRLYVSTRDTGGVQVLDGTAGYKIIGGISPCGDTGASPYGLEFNPVNDRLYIACAPHGNVNTAAVYQSTAGGLSRLGSTSIGNGGGDGGGGVAVNPANGHAFFTNSLANTVSVLNGSTNKVAATVPVGGNPFGLAVDPGTGRVYVADRASNDLYVFTDPVEP